MPLDPESFHSEPGGVHWRLVDTPRHGQFDIATVSSEGDWGPDPAGLAHLENALARVDALFDIALPAAEAGWAARYNGPLRRRDAWSMVRLFADASGRVVLSLNEGEHDTYCLWVITLVDGLPVNVEHRGWGG